MAELRYSIVMLRTDPPNKKAGQTVPVLHLRSELPIIRLRELMLEVLKLPPKDDRKWYQRKGAPYSEAEVMRAIHIAFEASESSILSELMNKKERQSVGTTTGRDG